jgi:hypothetical protein
MRMIEVISPAGFEHLFVGVAEAGALWAGPIDVHLVPGFGSPAPPGAAQAVVVVDRCAAQNWCRSRVEGSGDSSGTK